jgi:hypothetical protein
MYVNNISTNNYNFSSLRILATTGEPINKEAWTWYFESVGKKRCPIINLSGGTEVGGAILSAIPIMSLKPCTVRYPIPGFDVDVFDDASKHTRLDALLASFDWLQNKLLISLSKGPLIVNFSTTAIIVVLILSPISCSLPKVLAQGTRRHLQALEIEKSCHTWILYQKLWELVKMP